MNKEKVLTICIPTYNRSELVKKQMEFFKNEVENDNSILKKVKFIVGDNASTDNTIQLVREVNQIHPFFDLISNKINLGLIGNVINLLNLSYTEYIWFVSDDDYLRKGIVLEVLNLIEKHKDLNFIFLNYENNGRNGYTGDTGFFENSKGTALKIFDEAYGSLVFLTSCIYRRDNLIEISDNYFYNKLSSPLFYSFYSCSKGNIFVTQKTWVVFRRGNASYKGIKNFLILKFDNYVPILENLTNYGYNKEDVIKSIKSFFIIQSHSYFLYFFVRPLRAFLLLKYISIKALIYFPKNILSYLKE